LIFFKEFLFGKKASYEVGVQLTHIGEKEKFKVTRYVHSLLLGG